MHTALILVLLAALILFGMPVAFALFISGVVGIALVGSPDIMLGLLRTSPYDGATNYGLVTIPMFILMAQLITRGGLAADIFRSLTIWTGRIPGGHAVATIYASAGLGAISGSSVASASTMGEVAIPELRRLGYTPSFAVGSVAVAGTLAIMIPPSTGLILYAILTETSVGSMLIAGIIPGVLTATAYAAVAMLWSIRAKRRGIALGGDRYTVREKLSSSVRLWPFAVLIAAILGGIYSGAVSAIEASALGAVISFLLLVVMRRITRFQLVDAVREALHLSTMIAFIIIGASVFGKFLVLAQIPQSLVEALTSAGLSRWGILLLLLALVFVLGFFMDATAILSIVIPLAFPVITQLGFGPIWFGIVFTAVGEIGLVTPPLGLNVFVASAAGKEPVEVGFRGVWRYVAVQFVVVGSLLAFPVLSLALV